MARRARHASISIGVGPAQHAPFLGRVVDPGPLLFARDLAHLAQAVPGNDAAADQAREDAERQRHDTLGFEATGQGRGRHIGSGQVEHVLRVGSRVACGGDWWVTGCASGVVVLRNGQVLLKHQRGLSNMVSPQLSGLRRRTRGRNSGITYLDKGHNQARIHVPFDMAVEEPHSRIVAFESHHDMSVGSHEQHVSSHRPPRESNGPVERSGRVVVSRIFLATYDGLEVVPVQMERVLARVLVVQHDLNDLVVPDDIRVCVDTVNGRVGGELACRQDCVKGWDLGPNIGDSAEEGVVLNHGRDQSGHCSHSAKRIKTYRSVSQVIHHHVELHGQIRVFI